MINRRFHRLYFYPIVLLLVMGCKSNTPSIVSKPIAERSTNDPVTQRYEIDDMLFVPNDADPVTVDLTKPTTTPPGLFKAGYTQAGPDNNREKRISEVRQYILENVEPTSWKENGGAVGSIRRTPLRSLLVIETTPRIHKEVKTLLASLRQRLQIQISVDMRFIAIDEFAERKLSTGLQGQLALIRNAGRHRRDVYLSPEQRAELLATVEGSATTNSLGGPRLTMFNGQHAVMVVQTQQAYVANLAEVTADSKDAKSPRLYEPIVQTITASGIVLQVTACATPDGKAAFVDLHATAARLLKLLTEQFAATYSGVPATIQRPVLETFKLNVACIIPDGATLVLTGSTDIDSGDPAFNAGSPSRAASDAEIKHLTELESRKHLYLLMCPKVVVQKSPE